MASLSLSIIEIIVLMMGAIVLGITIHFFLVSRRNLNNSSPHKADKINKTLEEWKLRYFNDIESRDKELTDLRKRLGDSEENGNINEIEAGEMRKMNKKLQAELESIKKSVPQLVAGDRPGYIEQLRQAQSSLLEHNEKINQLLGQIDIVKETEEKQQEILKANEELTQLIDDLRFRLSQKEKEIQNVRQKEQLTKEMTSRLDSAYSEFNVLQDKIHKLEAQVSSSKMLSIEYEELKEGFYKVTRDFEDQKIKYNAAFAENQQFRAEITDLDQRLREAIFQRQQLQKRVSYLEELNNDMQVVSEANKKLEGQIKRIGELESMLNVVAEERDELAKKHIDG
jgi:chromosome segregation ATPase